MLCCSLLVCITSGADMIVIIDKERGYGHMAGMNNQMVAMADFIIELDGDVYRYVKDRETGLAGQCFPIEEAPDLVKQRLIKYLKFRDDISDDEPCG